MFNVESPLELAPPRSFVGAARLPDELFRLNGEERTVPANRPTVAILPAGLVQGLRALNDETFRDAKPFNVGLGSAAALTPDR